MGSIKVEFHWEYEKEKMTFKKEKMKRIVNQICYQEDLNLDYLSFIFVDDEYLKKLHAKYLNDDSYTDVITFDLRDDETREAEVYISVDRAKMIAVDLGIETGEELLRYIIHGILHLAGYDDKTITERSKMKEVENRLVDEFKDQIMEGE